MSLAVYVAGKTHDYLRVRKVQGWVRELGHPITFDWTQTVEALGPENTPKKALHSQLVEAAINDRQGVRDADTVIALMHPDIAGTIWELGMAAERETPTLIIGVTPRWSIFQLLPHIVQVPTPADDDQLRETVEGWLTLGALVRGRS